MRRPTAASTDGGGASGRRRSRLLVVTGALVLATLAASRPAAAQVLDRIVTAYQGQSGSWLERVVPVAQGTFALLAAIEFAVSGILWGLKRDALDQILGEAIRKFLLLSFLFALITAFPLFVPAITRGFEWAGQTASGTSVVNPSEILGLGIELATEILLAAGSLAGLNLGANLTADLAALLVVLAYAMIAAQLVLVLVETSIVLSGGVLFLGFAGFRGTAGFADNYLGWAFHVGIKIFLLYLLVGVGSAETAEWVRILPGAIARDSWSPLFEILGGALIFALLVWRIPHTVAAHLSSGATFRLQDALRGGGA